MLSDYDKILTMLKESSTTNVNSAESTMRKLAMQNIQMLACLHNALRDSNVEDQTQQMAASYINSLLIENIADYTGHQIFIFMKGFLLDFYVNIKHKKICSRSISAILESSEDQFMKCWVQLAVQCNQSIHDNVRLCSSFLLQCFSIAEIDCLYLYQLVNRLFAHSFQAIITQSMNQQQILSHGDIIHSWSITLDKLVLLSQQQLEDQLQSRQILAEISNSQLLWSSILYIYEYQAGSNEMYVCTNSQIGQNMRKLNNLKYQMAQLHYKALSSLRYHPRTKLFRKTGQQINKIVMTLALATYNSAFADLYEYEEFLVQLFKIFNFFLEIQPGIISDSWKSLIECTIFPIVKVTEEELTSFTYDPQQFLDIAEDCCESQKFQSIKSQACRALENIVDGSLKIGMQNQIIDFVFQRCITSIKSKMGLIHLQQTQERILDIETAFLIMGIFTYKINDLPDIIYDIRIILCDERIKNCTPLEMSRILLFLSYTYFDVFPNPADGNHWIQYALVTNENSTIDYCNIDLLFNISDRHYTDQLLISVLQKIFIIDIPNFWNLLIRLVEKHIKEIPPALILQTIEKCLLKINEQFQLLEKDEINEAHIAVKCFHVLRMIGDNMNPSYDGQIRLSLWKVTAFLTKAIQNEIEDQIVNIVSCFVKQSLVLEAHTRNILPFMIESFVKSGYEETAYFILFNHYIMKRDIEVVESIFLVLKKGLEIHLSDLQESPKKTKKKIIISHFLLLLQNIVALFGDKLNVSEMQILIQFGKTLCPQQEKKIYDKILLAKALNLMFLCHMHYNNKVVDDLLQYHDLKIYYSYDIKVLISCIKVQIFKEKDIILVAEYLNILTRIITIFLKHKDHLLHTKIHHPKDSKKNQLLYQKYLDFEAILQHIDTPFSNTKDYPQQMNEIIHKLKTNNLSLYHAMIQSMTTDIKEKLNFICTLQSCEDEEMRRKVKIVGIKSNTQPSTQQLPKADYEQDGSEQFKEHRKMTKKRKKQ